MAPSLPPSLTASYGHGIDSVIRNRWAVLKRSSGPPDAGIRIRLTGANDSLILLRTTAPALRNTAIRTLPVLHESNWRGGRSSGAIVALDHCPFHIGAGERDAVSRSIGEATKQLTDSLDLMEIASAMPMDGLFSARHTHEVRFTPEGECHWRDKAARGHFFVDPSTRPARYFIFFSLERIYQLTASYGKDGQRAPGLPEPWRILPYTLPAETRELLTAFGERASPTEAIRRMHQTLGTSEGPFTYHAAWGRR